MRCRVLVGLFWRRPAHCGFQVFVFLVADVACFVLFLGDVCSSFPIF